MRKTIAMILFLFIAPLPFSFFPSVKGENSIWIVDDDGPADFSTIREAVNAAEAGDTIFVRNGTYFENVVLNKSLNIIGENPYGTIIDGGGETVFHVVSGVLNLTCFTIRNASFGVLLDFVQNCSLEGNVFINNTAGLRGTKSSYCTVRNNLFEGNERGVWLTGFVEFEISGNVAVHNVYGFSVYDGLDTEIHGNLVENNSACGFHLQKFRRSQVYANTVKGNNYGFRLQFVWNNDFYHNNIINNAIQTAFVVYAPKPNGWDKHHEGNYWSDYNGTDSNQDGIGDSAYTVAEDNSDDFPLMNPYWNPADINHDLKVDFEDLNIAAQAFGTYSNSPGWNPHADITGKIMLTSDEKVDMRDISFIAKNYGQTYILTNK